MATTEGNYVTIQYTLERRTHVEATCRYLAKHRDTIYKDLPIDQLIPLAFYAKVSHLTEIDTNQLVTYVVQKYDKSKLYSDWQRYCRALDSEEQRVLATLEGSLFFARDSLPPSEDRELWTSSCLDGFHLLKNEIVADRGQKRKRGVSQSRRSSVSDVRNDTTSVSLPQTQVGLIHDHRGARSDLTILPTSQAQATDYVNTQTRIAMLAEVGTLESILGEFLCQGMDTSLMRLKEKGEGMKTFTDTVRLHLPSREGEDFKLEILLCSSIGKAVLEAKHKSIADLRSVLGDYLFEAMIASKWKGEEKIEKGECTGAVEVSFPNGDDSKLEVMLCFLKGKDVWAKIYSS